MDLTFQIIGLVAGAFSFVMLIAALRGLRRERRASRGAPVSGIFSATLLTGLFILVVGVPMNWFVALPLLGFGFFVGLLEGQFTRLYYRGPILTMKRGALYFILWGMTCLLTVLFALTRSSVLTAGGILAMIFGLGVAIGSNLNLLFRQSRMRPTSAATAATPFAPLRAMHPPDMPERGATRGRSKPTDLPR